MRLTDAQARALQNARLGLIHYDEVDERFYGPARADTMQRLDEEMCLLVMWHHRVGRRVPVTISGHGEVLLQKWERAQEARSKKKGRDVDASGPVAHGDTHVHYQF